jgi:large subunit ribosomal protein L1
MPQSKKYVDASRRYDKAALHQPSEAFELVKQLSNRNFDETVEAAFRLGVDPRKADQMLRGTVSLPAGTGKDVRVAVFAAGDAAREAEEAGADVVGADDLVNRVQNEGFLDFDIAIATPDMMGQVGKLGRVLGPRGLMPNPKTGTVTTDVGKAVEEFKGGKVEYRTDRYGNVHVPIGKVSFEPTALIANLRAVVEELQRAKPASAKGRYMKKIAVSSTMGPGIKHNLRLMGLGVSVYDVAPTVLHIYGIEQPKQMRGRVLSEIFEKTDNKVAAKQ